MKKIIIAICTAFTISSCTYSNQEVREFGLETNFVTYVWYNGEIIKAWYDPIDRVNVERVKLRQLQADSLMQALEY